MKPKTLVLAVVAVTCGLGASWMTSNLLASRQNAEVETVKLVLASKPLNIGDSIKNPETMFYIKDVPKDTVNIKAMVAENEQELKEKLKGRIIKKPVRKDDWIDLDDNTYDGKDPSGGIGVHLPAGMRAVSLRVNNKTAVGGFAGLPLSRVDILHSIRRGDDKGTYVQVLLENVLVLAADQQDTRVEGSKAMPSSVITVAVNPKDAMRVTLAEETGTMTFVVRKVGDYSRYNVTKLNMEELRSDTEPTLVKETENEEPAEAEVPPAPVLPPLPSAQEPVQNADLSPPPAPLAVAPAPAPEKVEPKWKKHTMVIYEGDNVRSIHFNLDPKTNRPPVREEVTKSELEEEAALPPPPSVTPSPLAVPTPSSKPQPKPMTPEPGSRDDNY
jgi:pilus assembly protein CpaB